MALRTNSRQAKTNIHNYIIESVDFQSVQYEKYYFIYDYDFSVVDRWSVWKNCVKQCFYEEKVLHDNRKMTLYEYFQEWLQGLPFSIGDYYYNVSAVDLLGELLAETETEKSRFTENQAEEMLTKLIYRELFL